MRTFNRVVIVVLSLLSLALCSLFLVVPVAFDVLVRQLVAWNTYLSGLEWYQRIPLGILFAAALDIVFILLIVLEVRRPAAKAIRVEKASGGEVNISVASIADRLKFEIDQLPGVLQVKPRVSARRRGVVVGLDVQAAAGVSVPQIGEQIVQLARRVVEEQIGLKLARPPKLDLRTVSYPRGPMWRVEPEVQVSPAAAGSEAATEAAAQPDSEMVAWTESEAESEE